MDTDRPEMRPRPKAPATPAPGQNTETDPSSMEGYSGSQQASEPGSLVEGSDPSIASTDRQPQSNEYDTALGPNTEVIFCGEKTPDGLVGSVAFVSDHEERQFNLNQPPPSVGARQILTAKLEKENNRELSNNFTAQDRLLIQMRLKKIASVCRHRYKRTVSKYQQEDLTKQMIDDLKFRQRGVVQDDDGQRQFGSNQGFGPGHEGQNYGARPGHQVNQGYVNPALKIDFDEDSSPPAPPKVELPESHLSDEVQAAVKTWKQGIKFDTLSSKDQYSAIRKLKEALSRNNKIIVNKQMQDLPTNSLPKETLVDIKIGIIMDLKLKADKKKQENSEKQRQITETKKAKEEEKPVRNSRRSSTYKAIYSSSDSDSDSDSDTLSKKLKAIRKSPQKPAILDLVPLGKKHVKSTKKSVSQERSGSPIVKSEPIVKPEPIVREESVSSAAFAETVARVGHGMEKCSVYLWKLPIMKKLMKKPEKVRFCRASAIKPKRIPKKRHKVTRTVKKLLGSKDFSVNVKPPEDIALKHAKTSVTTKPVTDDNIFQRLGTCAVSVNEVDDDKAAQVSVPGFLEGAKKKDSAKTATSAPQKSEKIVVKTEPVDREGGGKPKPITSKLETTGDIIKTEPKPVDNVPDKSSKKEPAQDKSASSSSRHKHSKDKDKEKHKSSSSSSKHKSSSSGSSSSKHKHTSSSSSSSKHSSSKHGKHGSSSSKHKHTSSSSKEKPRYVLVVVLKVYGFLWCFGILCKLRRAISVEFLWGILRNLALQSFHTTVNYYWINNVNLVLVIP